MSVIADIRAQSPDLAFTEALDRVADVRLEVVNELGTDEGGHYLFFWASGADVDTFQAGMAEDPTVASVRRYTEVDGRVLYRVELSDDTGVILYDGWVAVGADYIDARYEDGWWRARMRFPDRDALSQFEEWCMEREVTFELDSLYTDRPGGEVGSILTEAQQEVLGVALAAGYFEVPREATMGDVAARLDVSEQAVSERLRRGHRRLIAEHVELPDDA
jgi:hypothetical protein